MNDASSICVLCFAGNEWARQKSSALRCWDQAREEYMTSVLGWNEAARVYFHRVEFLGCSMISPTSSRANLKHVIKHVFSGCQSSWLLPGLSSGVWLAQVLIFTSYSFDAVIPLCCNTKRVALEHSCKNGTCRPSPIRVIGQLYSGVLSGQVE